MNYTQSDVAEFLNISKAAISKWEKGRSIPEVVYIIQLSKLFNTTIDELVNSSVKHTKEEIKRLYHFYSRRFSTEPFDATVDEVDEYARKHFNDYSLLLQFSVLLMNHHQLKPQSKVVQDNAVKYISRIIKHSDSLFEKEQATFLLASIYLQLGQNDSVIELLEDTRLPKLPANIVLSLSYLQNDDRTQANQTLQAEVYQNVIFMINSLTVMIQHQLHSNSDQLIDRGLKIAETFDLNNLHPNSIMNFYLASAINKRDDLHSCIDYLKRFNKIVKNMMENYYLHGDEFFDEIDDWIKDFDLGNNAPLNIDTFRRQVLVQVVSNPQFEHIKDTIEFKNIIHDLSNIVGE